MTGRSLSMGGSDPRDRRSMQEEERYEFPLRKDRNRVGVQVDPKNAIQVDPARGLGVRVGDGLALESRSPFRIVPVLGAGVELKGGRIRAKLSTSVRTGTAGELIARPTSAEVSDPVEGTTADGLARLGAALASIQAIIDAMTPAGLALLAETDILGMRDYLEAVWTSAPNFPRFQGIATLVGGTVNVSGLVGLTSGDTILVSHQQPSGTLGILSVTVNSATDFDIDSTDALDTSVVSYAIWQ